MKKKGFTLIELLVVIAIIAMLLAILMPALNKVKKIAQRVICGTNLKGLGNAQMVYANDYDDQYAVQGGGWGTGRQWSDNCGTDGWRRSIGALGLAAASRNNLTVGASLYLLVREADVSPKSFVCPAGGQQEFSGRNTGDSGTPFDIVDLWDFGHPGDSSAGPAEGPTKTVSYAYHNPYNASLATPTGGKSRYAATGSRSASFAVMADKNPWFDNKIPTKGGPSADNYIDVAGLLGAGTKQDGDWGAADVTLLKWEKDCANAQPHGREGQNVLYADGHSAYETRTDVSTKNDNIYTPWDYTPGTTLPSAQKTWRRGVYNASRNNFYPRATDDSVLVNDHKPTLTDLTEP
jgi:prepilin-type N-terminal cleavage/methylation domain-containing protein/prepilin-type processing-associated H-X9-DG protein